MIKARIFLSDGNDYFVDFKTLNQAKTKFQEDGKIWKLQVFDRTGSGMLCYENKQRKPKFEETC